MDDSTQQIPQHAAPAFAKPAPLHVELGEARPVYSAAIKYCRSMAVTAADKKRPNVNEARDIAARIVDSVQRNAGALVCLANFHYSEEFSASHPVNVAIYATVLAKGLDIPLEQWHTIAQSALLHDVGKAMLPDALISKPSELSPKERLIIEQHPKLGFDLFVGDGNLDPHLVAAILEHHENYDGTGYPKKLKGEAIGIAARVIRMADAYDARTNKQAIQGTQAHKQALARMQRLKGKEFTPGFVKTFIDCVGVYLIGSTVVLSDNRLALVAGLSPESPAQPPLIILTDEEGEGVQPERYYPAADNVQIDKLSEAWQARQDAVNLLESVRMP